jgi:hypothetical protein
MMEDTIFVDEGLCDLCGIEGAYLIDGELYCARCLNANIPAEDLLRWLARGIWDAIEDGIDGKEHTNARSNERRRKQIERGIIGETNMGTTKIVPNAAVYDADRDIEE